MDEITRMQRPIESNLRQLHAHWGSLKGDRRMPRRSEFEPFDVPGLLPHLTIVQPEGERFRVRLAGTVVHEAIPRAFRPGMMLDELESGAYLKFLVDIYRTVMESEKPVFSRMKYHAVCGEVVVSRLSVPLADDSDRLYQILSALAFSHAATTPFKVIVEDDFEHRAEIWDS